MNENIQEQLKKVFEHVATCNREMGIVQNDITNIKEDIKEIKACMRKVMNRLPVWATVIIAVLTACVGWLI